MTVEAGWTHWPAPAKLNLFLHVTGRRADGFHELQTVFRLLDWGDRVSVRPRNDGQILRVAGAAGVAPEDDLAVRAARLLAEHRGAVCGVDIAVEKRIPLGAGLGGGSSDAATVLKVLNRLWGLDLDDDTLAALGQTLGADVPVFVRGLSAWAEGIGEQLVPVALDPAWYVVVDPRCHVSTRELFAAPELTRDMPAATISDFINGAVQGNVFQPLVCRSHPRVAAAIRWLSAFAPARLTGTGAAVFAEFSTLDDARRARDGCPPEFSAMVARGVDRSPLLDTLQLHDWGVAKR